MDRLPLKFGVYEQSQGIEFPKIESEKEYKILVSLENIAEGSEGYANLVEKLKDNTCSTDWAFWFVRNQLIDSISFYLRTFEEPQFIYLRDRYREIAKLALEVLTSGWFLKELGKRDLSLDSDITRLIKSDFDKAKGRDKDFK